MMEPMALGSPSGGSPAVGGGVHPSIGGGGGGNFLPSYLMGSDAGGGLQTTPRSNTLSPTRGRTQLAFGNSPARGGGQPTTSAHHQQTPQQQQQGGDPNADFNRTMAMLQQRSLFGPSSSQSPAAGGGSSTYYQQHPNLQQHHHQSGPHHHLNQSINQQQQLNASLSGPPTVGLFDSLKATNGDGVALNATATTTGGQYDTPNQSAAAFNDTSCTDGAAYLTQHSEHQFNISSMASMRPPGVASPTLEFHRSGGGAQSPPTVAPFWVTVFGFPPAALAAILAHFAQCGTIVDKQLPAVAGANWMHLRYASRVECDKAVNFNERVVGNSLMVGVHLCRDAEIVQRECGGGGGEQLLGGGGEQQSKR